MTDTKYDEMLPFDDLELRAIRELFKAVLELDERVNALEGRGVKDHRRDDVRGSIVERFLDAKYPNGVGLVGMRPSWVQGIFYDWCNVNGVDMKPSQGNSKVVTAAVMRKFGYKLEDGFFKEADNARH